MQAHGLSERHACRLLDVARSTMRYEARMPARDAELRRQLRELAWQHMRFGFRRLTALLRKMGLSVNQKRVYRLYREEKLMTRVRKRRRRLYIGSAVGPPPKQANQRWSMDFVRDCLASGRVIRTLTIVDDCTRVSPGYEVDTSMSGWRVTRVLERIGAEGPLPKEIVIDNGPEFRSRAFTTWAEKKGIRLHFIEKGKPVQNAYVESFNGKLRDECLNANWFTSLRDARRLIGGWWQSYNKERPHSSLGYVAPVEYAATLANREAVL